jgi:hypothetical protein
MTEDGGLDESLNIYLDAAESAPALVPEDVTNSLGLPDDLQAEKVFVHKTANYENFIVVVDGNVVAYTPQIEDEEPLQVLSLTDGERINDIKSIGNTLVISTNANLYYILFKGRTYSYLGNKVPFPYITFDPQYSEDEKVFVSCRAGLTGDKWPYLVIPEEADWNEPYEKGEKEDRQPYLNLVNKYWEELNKKRQEYYADNKLTSVAIVRYSVDVMGEKLVSMPIVVNPTEDRCQLTSSVTRRKGYVEYEGEGESGGSIQEFDEWEGSIEAETQWTPYEIFAKINNLDNIEDWKDIIQGISIYVQVFEGKPANKSVSRIENRLASLKETKEDVANGESTLYEGVSAAELLFGDKKDVESFLDGFLFATANTRLVKPIKLLAEDTSGLSKDFIDLQQGFTLDMKPFLSSENGNILNTQEMLNGGDMKHYVQTARSLGVYNNQLLLIQPSQIIDYDYGRLNAYDKKNTDDLQQADSWRRYEVTYLLEAATEDKVVKAGPFIYWHRSNGNKEEVYPFQIFPDARAYQMIVKMEFGVDQLEDLQGVKYGVFDMAPHPYLDCAYYYGGFAQQLNDLCVLESADDYPIDAIDDLENRVIASDVNDPFIFPLQHRYAFQAKVLGVAIATTTLSQGQFGQFPLYVFTEDGIWAMETAADGSFVTSKPLSRDVCVNPESITSIDNAVVFVSDKGVMLLQGSQVVNISPFMTGRHYTINQSAKDILETSDYASLLPSLTDADTFMGFVKKASVAYDYAGKRLVFIARDEAYQYVYKLDTQTWHKLKHEVELIEPINSYPECLVRGKEEHHFISLYIVHAESRDDRTYELFKREAKKILSLTENQISMMWNGGSILLDLNKVSIDDVEGFIIAARHEAHVDVDYDEMENVNRTRVYDISTILDGTREQSTELGCLITRPLDLGYADIKKVIKDIRIRGEFAKGHVQYILQGSDDGVNYFNTSLKQKSWKLFRIIIVCALDRFERISWIDVDYDTRYNNKLR